MRVKGGTLPLTAHAWWPTRTLSSDLSIAQKRKMLPPNLVHPFADQFRIPWPNEFFEVLIGRSWMTERRHVLQISVKNKGSAGFVVKSAVLRVKSIDFPERCRLRGLPYCYLELFFLENFENWWVVYKNTSQNIPRIHFILFILSFVFEINLKETKRIFANQNIRDRNDVC